MNGPDADDHTINMSTKSNEVTSDKAYIVLSPIQHPYKEDHITCVQRLIQSPIVPSVDPDINHNMISTIVMML
jgi:hypothetical protein